MTMVAVLCTCVTLQATSITVDTWLSNPSLYGGYSYISLNSQLRMAQAGQFLAIPADPNMSPWITYCTDLNYWLANGQFSEVTHDWDIVVNHNPPWVGSGYELAEYVYITYGPSVNSNAKAVGLQLAIWNLLYDTDRSLSSGTFYIYSDRDTTKDAQSYGQLYLNDINMTPIDGIWWKPINTSGGYRESQGLMGVDVPDGNTTTAGLLSISLLGLVCSRRLFKKSI